MKMINGFIIPESWSEITISQLKQMKGIKEDGTIKTHFEVLKIFNPDADLLSSDFTSVIEAVGEIYKVIASAPVPVKSDGAYKIGENSYRLMNIEELDFQTFLDFQSVATGHQNEWEKIENLGLIISLLTADRPSEYDVKEFGEIVEGNVSVIDGTSLLLFFSDVLTTYLQNSPIYSQYMKEQKKISEEKKMVD